MARQRFRDLSIRSKLALLSVVATSTALVLACVAFAGYDRVTFRGALVRRLSTQAEIIGFNSASALVFDDPDAAAGTLAALRAEPHVIAASIFAQDGRLFARYVREPPGPETCRPDFSPGRVEGHRFEGNHLLLYRRVVSNGEAVGVTCIQSDLQEMNERLGRYGGIAVSVLLVSLMVGFVVSTRLQRVVAEPILQLAEVAQRVSADKDYSLGAASHSRDETGLLVESFNQMLSEIQRRDSELTQEIAVRAQAEQRLRAKTLRLEALHEIDKAILDRESVDELIGAALERIRFSIPCHLAAVLLFDVENRIVQVLATDAADIRTFGAATLPLEDFSPPATFIERPVIYIEDFASTHMPRSVVGERLRVAGMRSVLGAAFIGKGQLLGVLSLCSTQPAAFSAEHREIARESADQLAIAIVQARLHEELQRYAAELEDRVRDRTQQLEAANQELEAFSYSVSHDLRAPLRGMRGMATALVEDYAEVLDATGRDFAGRIVAAATRMDTLIQDLLSYSRLSRAELPPERVGLSAVVQEAAAQVASDLAARGTHLTVEPFLPDVVAHHGTLVQVVANLLSNAVKFVPADIPPQVHIRAESHSGRVRLWVEDNGIGIAPDHQERIFRMFERLQSSDAYPGTGIGLGIVQRGATRMGGSVGVESALGQGSRFWIELAIVEEPV